MNNKTKIQKLTLSSLLTATLCVCSMLSLNLGGISFSFALLGVFIIGMILPPIYSVITVSVYVMIGLLGIPVFANFNSGFGALLGPSGGFIISYPIVALIISLLVKRLDFKLFKVTVITMLALLISYLCGCLWYSYVCDVSFLNAVFVCVIPFILFDFIKIQLAYFITKIIRHKI